MVLLWMIVIGFVIGVIARALLPGRDPYGFITTVVIGIAGSLIAGYLGHAMGLYQPGEPAGFLASIVGAMIVLAVYRAAVRGRMSGI